jgi:hypothetical protein
MIGHRVTASRLTVFAALAGREQHSGVYLSTVGEQRGHAAAQIV